MLTHARTYTYVSIADGGELGAELRARYDVLCWALPHPLAPCGAKMSKTKPQSMRNCISLIPALRLLWRE